MHLIVGLGNPGSEYMRTRHNIGFLVVDEFAASAGASFSPGKSSYWLAECSLKGINVVAFKPTTYMNNSGFTVQEFMIENQIPIENLLIVCDDFNLPVGTLRLRKDGTDGGHNGLASIIYNLQTDQFARLRCGIGQQSLLTGKKNMKDFVLEDFLKSEEPLVKTMIQQAGDACISYITEGIDRAMNRFNTALNENNLK